MLELLVIVYIVFVAFACPIFTLVLWLRVRACEQKIAALSSRS